MSTNDEDQVVEESQETTTAADLEAELREAKANEDKPVAEETPAEQEVTPEEKPEESKDTTLTTEVHPERDLAWYQKAYDESTKEALRLKAELDKQATAPAEAPAEPSVLSPEQLYIRQMQDKEIADAFTQIRDKYPQVNNPDQYKQFTAMANTFGKTILDVEKRLATPQELYQKTVIALGWQPDNSEQIAGAVKDSAATPRVASATPAPTPQSKVTEDMIAFELKLNPNKTRAEIIEELEPYVN